MSKRNTAISLLTALFLVISSITGVVSAKEPVAETCPTEVYTSSEATIIQRANTPGTIVPFGVNPPGLFAGTHNLAEEDYTGSFSGVTYSVFTNKYFKANSAGCVYLEIETDEDCTITLHDSTDGTETSYSISSGELYHIKWPGMQSGNKYYFEFSNDQQSFAQQMSGEFTISHSSFLN